MLDIERLFSDPYNRRARLQPALFTILPVLLTSLLMCPSFETQWPLIASTIALCGGAAVLAQIGRHLGKKAEQGLYPEWSPKPSVGMLRHSDRRISAETKSRYRSFLAERIPRLQLPSIVDETNRPSKADAIYGSAIEWLIGHTRDRSAFNLVFEENVNYGFRRNLWALKPIGIALDATCIAVIGTVMAARWEPSASSIDVGAIAAIILAVLHLLVLILFVRRDWVRASSEAYGRQLLAACDMLRSRYSDVAPGS